MNSNSERQGVGGEKESEQEESSDTADAGLSKTFSCSCCLRNFILLSAGLLVAIVTFAIFLGQQGQM